MPKKTDIIKVYRPASPRLQREIDIRAIEYKKLKRYLKSGWHIYRKETKQPQPQVVEKKGINDLTDDEIQEIKDADGSLNDISDRFNVTFYAVRKLRSKK